MLSDILSLIEELAYSNKEIAYIILGISAFVENIFPPIPGDTVTVFGAFLVGKKSLDFFWVFVSTTIGSIMGFMFLFYIFYLFGKEYLEKKEFRFFNMSHIEKVNKWFSKYGYLVILLNRFASGFRSVISVAAGIIRFNPLIVFILAFLSCIVWNFLLLYIGYITGDNWEEILIYIEKYSKIVLVLIIIFILFFVFKKKFIKSKGMSSK